MKVPVVAGSSPALFPIMGAVSSTGRAPGSILERTHGQKKEIKQKPITPWYYEGSVGEECEEVLRNPPSPVHVRLELGSDWKAF